MRRFSLTQLVLASSCLLLSIVPNTVFGAPQVIAADANIDASGKAEGVIFNAAAKLTVTPGDQIGSTAGVSAQSSAVSAPEIIFQGSSIVTGSISATPALPGAGNRINTLQLQGGAGTTVTLNGITILNQATSKINFTTLAGASLNVTKNLLMGGGTIDLQTFGTGSIITFADGANFSGAIDTKTAGTGSVVFLGSSNVTNGVLGVTNALLNVDLGSGLVFLNAAGTNQAANFNFTSNASASTLKLRQAALITGNIDNTSGTAGSGTLLFDKNSTVTGDIGTSNPLSAIQLSDFAGGSTVNLIGNVNANTIQLGNTIVGNQNTLVLSAAATSTVAANITTAANGVGLVNLDKVATFTGDIGSSGLNVNTVTVVTNNDTTVDGSIYATNGVVFGANNILTIASGGSINSFVQGTAGNAGQLVFAGSSSSNGKIGQTNGLAAVSFNGGTFGLNDDIAATNVSVKNGATLAFNQNKTITGNLNLDATGGNLQIGLKTATITGNLNTVNNTNNITIDINQVNPDKISGIFGNLAVTGNAAMTASVINFTTSGYVPNGTHLKIISTTTGITGAPTAVSSTLLTNFTLNTIGKDLFVDVIRKSNASISGDPFTLGIVGALDVIQNTPALIANPDIFAVINELDNFTNRADFNNAIATLAPSVDGDNKEGIFSVTRLGIEAIRDRLDSYRLGQLDYVQTGYSAGSYNTLKDYGVWVKLLASRLKQSEYKGIEGYKSDVWGITGGVDYTSPDNVIVYGVGLNYANTESLSRTNAASTNTIDSYSLMLYGTYNFENPWYLDGIVYLTNHDYDQTRHIKAGIVSNEATAKYRAWQVSARAETGFVYQYNKVLFQPILGLFYSHLDRDSYTEEGANGLNLSNRPRDVNSLKLSVGPKISSVLGSEGASVIPELHAYYNFEMAHSKEQIVSNFVIGGPIFETAGIEGKRSSYNVGVGLAAYGFENISYHVSLDYEFNETKFSAWHGSMKFKYTWY